MGKRWIWVLAGTAALATAASAFWKPAETRLTDLSVYLGAVSGLADGAGLYDFTRGAAPFTYPPFAALLFTPLTWLPVGTVQVLWTLATLATVLGLATLATHHHHPRQPSTTPPLSATASSTSPTASTTAPPTSPTATATAPASLTASTTAPPTSPTTAATTPASLTASTTARSTATTTATTPASLTASTTARSTSPTTSTTAPWPNRWAAARLTGTRLRTAIAALALILSAPVSSDVKYGQVSLFLAALVLADLLALRRTPWHGALIGLAAAVKLTPLIFIPLLWLAGRRIAAAVSAASFAACALIGAAILPGDSWTYWTDKVFQPDRLGHIEGVGNQSLNGALLRLGIAAEARSTLVVAIGGTIAAVALIRAVRLARRSDWLSAAIVVGAASVVLSPVSWTHHQIWLVLAALLPVAGPRWARAAWPATILAVMLLPVTAVATLPFSESRLVLAVAVAALIPLREARSPAPAQQLPTLAGSVAT
ncbi:glycosyltransferase 87 family protein [Paractinoplanes maris]|uniref:glycosyltransferase 87 family protein n=1 Tax=Paractinoplanes maris TaxID=1734446 RepID=UPI0020216398|nr:glycosyltransferase 87 family protein [Actinoplanes maris]